MDETVFQRLPEVLLPWYDANKRELPWRQDRDPYHVWISEIMLQQTRVEAVKGYYSRFLQALPDISSLAKADDELLHKLQACQFVHEHGDEVCPAKWQPGAETLKPSLDLVGQL